HVSVLSRCDGVRVAARVQRRGQRPPPRSAHQLQESDDRLEHPQRGRRYREGHRRRAGIRSSRGEVSAKSVKLKTSYSAREVTALTGLSARQLQTWDAARIFPSAIAPRRTSAGGFTERRYTPVDVIELLALADLRRRGFAPAQLKQAMDTLRDYFRRR